MNKHIATLTLAALLAAACGGPMEEELEDSQDPVIAGPLGRIPTRDGIDGDGDGTDDDRDPGIGLTLEESEACCRGAGGIIKFVKTTEGTAEMCTGLGVAGIASFNWCRAQGSLD